MTDSNRRAVVLPDGRIEGTADSIRYFRQPSRKDLERLRPDAHTVITVPSPLTMTPKRARAKTIYLSP
jgi:hypothetical protein